MLVLSRKRDESISIEFAGVVLTTITVTAVQGDRVKLGFEGDRAVTVRRTELPSKCSFDLNRSASRADQTSEVF